MLQWQEMNVLCIAEHKARKQREAASGVVMLS